MVRGARQLADVPFAAAVAGFMAGRALELLGWPAGLRLAGMAIAPVAYLVARRHIMALCPRCGYKNRRVARFCAGCGLPRSAERCQHSEPVGPGRPGGRLEQR